MVLTEILVEQQSPEGVFFCDHAGLVINKFSLGAEGMVFEQGAAAE